VRVLGPGRLTRQMIVRRPRSQQCPPTDVLAWAPAVAISRKHARFEQEYAKNIGFGQLGVSSNAIGEPGTDLMYQQLATRTDAGALPQLTV
jgi:hypothetical protein